MEPGSYSKRAVYILSSVHRVRYLLLMKRWWEHDSTHGLHDQTMLCDYYVLQLTFNNKRVSSQMSSSKNLIIV